MNISSFIWLKNAADFKCVKLKGRCYIIKLLPAVAMLSCICEANILAKSFTDESADASDGAADLFAENAAVCAAALYKRGRRVFKSADEAARALSADEIAFIAAEYGRLREKSLDRLSAKTGGNADFLKKFKRIRRLKKSPDA